ncbi:flavin-containing monooxygenase [Streptomyces gobiensis]|uniref:flavin-containing monooxygenase n=1 Tax=Streptomyces gobiensis TaxID=2875706 RepID=UPI001E472680|nr:NAD(P)/FAD-dependent oxidoreductase [Streptomyces gobiensis]UGY94188.1 NAD(P)/FAD-dependent oxidoreductase [Streptomyces gobiensis]
MTSDAGGSKGLKVVIIGTGLGGVGVAVHLKKAGVDNLVILEKGHDVGGVWRDNTYPGAACDVPSTLYSYSFEKGTRWTHRYSGQAEIQRYIRSVAEKYGLIPHMKFNATVVGASFREETGDWSVVTEQGEEIIADVVIPAVGTLARPRLPSIPGRDSFEGRSWHSSRWNHDVSLEGKRVAVIGTGASALQFVPHVQEQAASMTLFQRSAPYIMPYHNFSYEERRHRYKRVRILQDLDRFMFWYLMEIGQQFLTKWPKMRPLVKFMSLGHLKKQVRDPELREKLTPDDEFGCKRVLFSSKFYPALTQPNVEVVTEGIEEITPRGIRTVDGVENEFDVIIYGTGFKTFDIFGHMKITGLDNRLLSEQWKEGAHAYLGMAVPNFPNMFIVYGPNTDLGSGSVMYMLESQFPYIRQAVERIRDLPEGSYLSVRPDVWRKFDEEIQSKLSRSVWVSGCSNWYRNEHGRVVTNWPERSWRFRRRARIFELDKYRTDTAVRSEESLASPKSS